MRSWNELVISFYSKRDVKNDIEIWMTLLFDGKKFIIEFRSALDCKQSLIFYFFFYFFFFWNPVDHSSRARARDERRSCEEQGRKPKRRKSKSFFRSQPQSLLLLYFFALRARVSEERSTTQSRSNSALLAKISIENWLNLSTSAHMTRIIVVTIY